MTRGIVAVQFGASEAAMLIVIALLLVVLVVLAIAETSLTRMSKPKAAALAEDGGRRARTLNRLVQRPERWLNTVLLTVTAAQTVQSVLVGLLANSLFGAPGVAIATVFNVGVMFVIAESAPKTWAVLHPDQAALLAARPVAALVAFAPLRVLTRALIGLTNVVIPGRGIKGGPFVSEAELLALADAAVEEAVIEQSERELIESIIEFGDTLAREVMVPRPDMVTVPASATVAEAIDIAIAHGFSRIPVIGDDSDDIVGIAYAKDLMRFDRDGRRGTPVKAVARKAHFVPETKPVAHLLREMQAEHFHMALLVDEYGGIAGLVTLEDLVEELIGEIVDEYDVESDRVERLSPDELLVDGGLDTDELAALINIDLPDEEWDTVGGFVFGTLGHVPDVGESVQLTGWDFSVAEMDGRRIAKVRVSRVPGWVPPPREDDDEDDDEDEDR